MNRIGNYLGAFLMTLVLVLSVNLASAQKHGDRSGKENLGKRGEKMCEMLNLTEIQKASYDKIKLDVDKKSIALDNKLGELKAKKRTLMSADNIDKKAVDNNIKEMSDVKEQKQLLRANQMIELRKILTEEQKVKFDKMHSREGRNKGNSKMHCVEGNDKACKK